MQNKLKVEARLRGYAITKFIARRINIWSENGSSFTAADGVNRNFESVDLNLIQIILI